MTETMLVPIATAGPRAQADAERPPLEIGIAVDDLERLQPWAWRLIDRLAHDARFRLVARIAGSGGEVEPDEPATALAPLLALDRSVFARLRSYPADAARAQVERLPVVDTRSAALQLDAPTIQFDVALRLDGPPLPVCILRATRLAEVSLRFGGRSTAGSDVSAAASLAAGSPCLSVEVCARRPGDAAAAPIAQADYNLKFSAARSGAFVREKAVLLLIRTLAGLRDGDNLLPTPGRDPARPEPPRPAAYAAALCGSVMARTKERILERFGRDASNWQLALGRGGPTHFDPALAGDVPRFEFNMADPFLFEHGGRLYLFYEADNGGGEKAWISVALVDGDTVRPLGEALRRPYHLSYPHVFRAGGEIFMLPETQQANRLEEWRCTRFPDQWDLHAVALEGRFPADSNLFTVDDRWWLMSNLSDHHDFQEHSSELYLFETDGPDLRRIEPHPANPVVIGSSRARNAGAVFSSDGRLYRPSQINAFGVYGYGLNVMQIERIDRSDYRERLVRRITPDVRPGLAGIHHLGFGGGRFVVDVFRPTRGAPPLARQR